MFQIDAEFIERLKREGYDLWTIYLWENWLQLLPQLAEVVQTIAEAFDEVTLGDGVGLYEANGLDDYASDAELARLRELDERNDWRKIDAASLNQYYSSPSFFDARGFAFHLPAFLLAELADKHDFNFIDRVIQSHALTSPWLDLLTPPQAEALVAVLTLLKQHPEYYLKAEILDRAIDRYAEIAARGR